MNYELSHQAESFLAYVVSGGQYPTKEAALEAAVAALREKHEQPPNVPAEHLDQLERSLESAEAGRLIPVTTEYWRHLHETVPNTASNKDKAG